MAREQPATETRFAVTRRNRVVRRPMRGDYDKKAIKTVMGDVVDCPRQPPGVKKPGGMRAYRSGRKLDEILAETYRETLGSS